MAETTFTKQSSARHKEALYVCDKQIIDCKVLESKGIDSINSTIYFMGVELTGGIESDLPYNECFFGSVDSKDTQMGLDETKPVYYLESNDEIIDSNNTESNNSLSILNVFLNSSTLTFLNYSLLDSSLNIKLECNSKESKEILERASTKGLPRLLTEVSQ